MPLQHGLTAQPSRPAPSEPIEKLKPVEPSTSQVDDGSKHSTPQLANGTPAPGPAKQGGQHDNLPDLSSYRIASGKEAPGKEEPSEYEAAVRDVVTAAAASAEAPHPQALPCASALAASSSSSSSLPEPLSGPPSGHQDGWGSSFEQMDLTTGEYKADCSMDPAAVSSAYKSYTLAPPCKALLLFLMLGQCTHWLFVRPLWLFRPLFLAFVP